MFASYVSHIVVPFVADRNNHPCQNGPHNQVFLVVSNHTWPLLILKDIEDLQMNCYFPSIFCKKDLFWRQWLLLIFR